MIADNLQPAMFTYIVSQSLILLCFKQIVVIQPHLSELATPGTSWHKVSRCVKSTSRTAGYACSLTEESLLYFHPILSDRLNNATEESLQHDQTTQLTGL